MRAGENAQPPGAGERPLAPARASQGTQKRKTVHDVARGQGTAGSPDEKTTQRATCAQGDGNTAAISRRSTTAEAARLGVDPAVWTRIIDDWAGANGNNKDAALEFYEQGTMRRHDYATLKEGGELTGDIINEVGRHIATSAPHVAFRDSTFLHKVAPTNGAGSKCRRYYWTRASGTGTDSKIGTTKKLVIAPHHAPVYW